MVELPKINSNKSLVDKAYDVIKKAILNMDFEPGEALPEEKLVEQLGISRTPIRSALNKLAHEELVEIYPGKGTYVASISNKSINDTLQVRKVLEILSAELAATKIKNDKDFEQIKEAIKEQEELLKEEEVNIYHFLELDNKIHNLISNMGNNDVLKKQIEILKNKFNRSLIFSKSLKNQERMKSAIEEHKEILKAIRAGDKRAASKAMNKHIKNVKTGIEIGLERYFDDNE